MLCLFLRKSSKYVHAYAVGNKMSKSLFYICTYVTVVGWMDWACDFDDVERCKHYFEEFKFAILCAP